MSTNKIKPVIVLLFLLITGCTKKDDLTLPVKVYFKIGVTQNSPYSADSFNFDECKIGIQSIGFVGKREAGGDYYFETDSKMNLETITFMQPVQVAVFDIPQGIYYYMKWALTMKCVNPEGLDDGRDESDPCIGVTISGNYMTTYGVPIPFILAIDEAEQFEISASDPEGKSIIALSVDREYEATVLFDPEYAFNSITREAFESTESSVINGHQTIIISSHKNTDLYMILLYRIFQNVTISVK
jgi:hypothetical protein